MTQDPGSEPHHEVTGEGVPEDVGRMVVLRPITMPAGPGKKGSNESRLE